MTPPLNTLPRDAYSSKNQDRKAILLAIVTALVITIFQIQLANFIFTDIQDFWQSGSPSYGIIAHSITEKGIFSLDQITPTAYRPPLYPLFLAAFLSFTNNPEPIIVAQSIFAGLTFALHTLLTYRFTKKSWPTLVIIFLFALGIFIPLDNVVQHETVLFTFLLTLGGYIFTSEMEAHTTTKVLALGFVLGLSCLVRPLAPAVLLASGIWFLWLLRTHKSKILVAKRLALFLLTFLLTLVPWGIRNWQALGTFSLSTTTSGINLWKGNNPATKDIYPTLEIDLFTPLLTEIPSESGWWDSLKNVPTMSEVEQNEYLFSLGMQYIQERPFHFLKMGLTKSWALWTPQNVPLATGVIKWTPSGAIISDIVPYYDNIIATLILYLFLLPGLWKQRRSPFVWYLVAWSIALTAIHFITFAESRFRWPLNMLMLPIAAAGFEHVSSKTYYFFKKLIIKWQKN